MWKKTRTISVAVLALSAAALISAPANADHRHNGKSHRTTVHVKKVVKKVVVHERRGRHWRQNKRHWRKHKRHVRHHHKYRGHRWHKHRPVYRKKVVQHHYHHKKAPVRYYDGSRAFLGGLIGAVVGATIINAMDQNDHAYTHRTLNTARTGDVVTWRNPDSGAQYSVSPTKEYRTHTGQYCREFATWGWIGGYEERLYGTACRMPDGSWRRVR